MLIDINILRESIISTEAHLEQLEDQFENEPSPSLDHECMRTFDTLIKLKTLHMYASAHHLATGGHICVRDINDDEVTCGCLHCDPSQE